MRSCRPLVLFKLSFVKVFIAIISLKPLTVCVMSHDFILFVIVFRWRECASQPACPWHISEGPKGEEGEARWKVAWGYLSCWRGSMVTGRLVTHSTHRPRTWCMTPQAGLVSGCWPSLRTRNWASSGYRTRRGGQLGPTDDQRVWYGSCWVRARRRHRSSPTC